MERNNTPFAGSRSRIDEEVDLGLSTPVPAVFPNDGECTSSVGDHACQTGEWETTSALGSWRSVRGDDASVRGAVVAVLEGSKLRFSSSILLVTVQSGVYKQARWKNGGIRCKGWGRDGCHLPEGRSTKNLGSERR